MLRSLVLLAMLAAGGASPPSGQPAPAAVMGTYRYPGCQMQVAPTAPDSVHIQLFCDHGPPGHHIGFIDEQLPIHAGLAVYRQSDRGGPCEIRIRFADTQAVVTQKGIDIMCGFGAYVNVSGTYRRTSRARPPFDLDPCDDD